MSLERLERLSDDQFRILDEATDAFENELNENTAGNIEGHLERVDPDLRPTLFQELLTVELEVLRRSGQEPDLSKYRARFPTLDDEIDVVVAELAAHQMHHDTETNDTALRTTVQRDDRRSRNTTRSDLESMPDSVGRYALIRPLGRGGMGAVYLAHDRQLDRQVAVKVPEFGNGDQPAEEAIQRFYREARAMAAVRHPNLCPIYDVGDSDGKPYLTMAYVDGRSLAELICEKGPWPPDEAASLVSTLARAVQTIHDAGIVHRDLKPSNVMIDGVSTPLITDFGLASDTTRGKSDLTRSGDIIGTPAYMAPEQIRNEHQETGPQTDVYALGCIFYQLLCGRRPYEGSAMQVLAQVVVSDGPKTPSQFAEVDPKLEAICLRAMAYDIDDRFESADDLGAALTSAIESIDNRDQEMPAAPAMDRTTPLWLTSLAASCATVAVVVTAIQFLNSQEEPHETSQSEFVDTPADQPPTRSRILPGKDVSIPSGPPSQPTRDIPAFAMTSDWEDPEFLGPLVNGPEADGSPTLSRDQLTLIFHRPLPDNTYQLWSSRRDSPDEPFDRPELMGPEVNQHITTNAHLSIDGRTLLFDSTRPGGLGGYDLWFCRRDSVYDEWSMAMHLGSAVNSPNDDSHPFLSADGRTLLFASSRLGGYGRFDIWMATRRTPSASFGKPVNLGPDLNGPSSDRHPWLSSDGLVLVFCSGREGGLGGFDLWFSSRKSANASFSRPVNLGSQINSAGNEAHAWLSPDGSSLYFESERVGSKKYDIMRAVRR